MCIKYLSVCDCMCLVSAVFFLKWNFKRKVINSNPPPGLWVISPAGWVTEPYYTRPICIELHDELHWLDIPQRVDYKLCATVHRCLQCILGGSLHTGLRYCQYRQHLRSASSNQLVVRHHRRTQFGRRAFSVAGPMAWNALFDSIRDTALSTCSFRRNLKTLLFSFY